MRRWIQLVLFSGLIIGCNSKDGGHDVIPAAKMQVILSDLMKADQFISDFRVPHDTVMDRDAESIKLYKQVFSIHDISREQFQKSLTYYQSRPDLLKTIMDSISKQVIAAPPSTTTPADTVLRKDTAVVRKDSLILPKDSLIKKKKALLLKNKQPG